MRVLGIDPSLTAFGWAVIDDSFPQGDPRRCEDHGRFQTPSEMEFVDRYISMRESLRGLLQRVKPEKVGIEHPIFNDLFSEGMYGLFLYSCEALKLEGADAVFWTPLQVKARAREIIVRPKGWKMEKPDMVEAAKADTGIPRWNHNEADAYLVGLLSSRFWGFHDGVLQEGVLSPVEKNYFTKVRTYSRGANAGKTLKTGMVFREDDRFFLWSQKRSDV